MKTLRDIHAKLLEHYTILDMRPGTLQRLRQCGNSFLRWLERKHGITEAGKLRSEHIRDFQKHLSEHITAKGLPYKPSTINSQVKSLKTFLDFMHDRSYIIRPMSRDIAYIREPKFLPSNVLSHKEVRKLIRSVDTSTPTGIRDRAIIELLYTSGIRIGELEILTLEDIDLDHAVMKVLGKGTKERMVPIGKTALRWLTSYIRGARPFMAGHVNKNRSVFLNRNGDPVSQVTVRHMIHDYEKKAKIKINVTPHTFRRSCTTEMIKGDAGIYHVKELLGHESLETLRHYAKLNISDLQKTHAKCHPREKDDS